MTTHKFCIRVRELVTQIVLLFAFVCCFDSIYAQSSDISSLDRGRKEFASLNLSSEVESRLGHALNVYEKMVQGGRYISSIAELIKDKEMSLPVGLKSDKYVVCIEELYEDSLSDGQKRYIKAICKIPISDKH